MKYALLLDSMELNNQPYKHVRFFDDIQTSKLKKIFDIEMILNCYDKLCYLQDLYIYIYIGVDVIFELYTNE